MPVAWPVTQTEPSPTAIPFAPALDRDRREHARPVARLIRETLRSLSFATQTYRPPTATPAGAFPTRDRSRDDGVGLGVDLGDGAVEAVRDPDQALPRRRSRQGRCRPGRPGSRPALTGSILETLWASTFATQIDPSHAVIAPGEAPTGIFSAQAPGLRVEDADRVCGDGSSGGGRRARAAPGAEDDRGGGRSDDQPLRAAAAMPSLRPPPLRRPRPRGL